MLQESCSICAKLEERLSLNLLEGGAGIPAGYEKLSGWEGRDLSSGYQKFRVVCPECSMGYLVEVDVEPFVWDLDVTRLTGRFADYRGVR